LQSGVLNSGTHEARWDAYSCASGLYFARLQTGNSTRIQKLLLSK
jgi:hypothetical protein